MFLLKLFKRILLGLIILALGLSFVTFIVMQQKTFGRNPSGERLKRIEKSVHYKNGAFQNLTPTEVMLKDASYIKMMKDFLNKPANATPQKLIPSQKTDLKKLQADTPIITWFGHSSYLIQSKGVHILVDPVFSGNASPFSFFGKSFKGTDVYGLADMPKIDIIIITHDHYDHLDYKTISKLPTGVRFYAPLGVGAHLEHWAIAPENIIEYDWWEGGKIGEGIHLTAAPARHFSGRGFQRGKTLWASYVLQLHGYTLLLGGDSGYESHFKEIGARFGPFDLAILESGQYGESWPYIHMMPEQTIQAAKDLQAKVLFPVHWSKFALAYHAWNEPIERIMKSASQQQVKVTTPLIGEPIILDKQYPQKSWWKM
jgi:L-ascorbate metabolism protein UlaG (beta-lactamase superfamily)